MYREERQKESSEMLFTPQGAATAEAEPIWTWQPWSLLSVSHVRTSSQGFEPFFTAFPAHVQVAGWGVEQRG